MNEVSFTEATNTEQKAGFRIEIKSSDLDMPIWRCY